MNTVEQGEDRGTGFKLGYRLSGDTADGQLLAYAQGELRAGESGGYPRGTQVGRADTGHLQAE